jgi:hypothetical protein
MPRAREIWFRGITAFTLSIRAACQSMMLWLPALSAVHSPSSIRHNRSGEASEKQAERAEQNSRRVRTRVRQTSGR